MLKINEEKFLLDYFTYAAVVGKFCDKAELFDLMVQIHHIPQVRKAELYTLVTSSEVCDIATLGEYKLQCRLRKYAQLRGIDLAKDGATEDILKIKGRALYIVNECDLGNIANDTKASVYDKIVQKANAGKVTALRLYGVLQCRGLFLAQNSHNGVKNLTRAARWNSEEALLALLYFDATNADKYGSMLYTLTSDTPYGETALNILHEIGIGQPQKSAECVLLTKVFGRGHISPNVYIANYANLLYSPIVSFADKKRFLLSDNADALASCANLPLNFSKNKLAYFPSAIAHLPLSRVDEQNVILQNAVNGDICHLRTFKPLCLCSDSVYMRNYYAKAIEGLYKDANVVTLQVADMEAHDLEPTAHNVFVRSCADDKANVFLLFFVGEIGESQFKEACDFLQSAKRARMRLMQPDIQIDLSDVLPVCLCDKANAQAVSQYCNQVQIMLPDKRERTILINELIVEKKQQYGLNGLVLGQEIVDKLNSVSVDEAEYALDLAIAANRHGEKTLTLTSENSGKYMKKRDISRGFGYGGCGDDY